MSQIVVKCSDEYRKEVQEMQREAGQSTVSAYIRYLIHMEKERIKNGK